MNNLEIVLAFFYPVSMHFSKEPPGHCWPPRLACLRWLLPLPFPVLLLRWAEARGLAAEEEAGTRFWLQFLLEFLRPALPVAPALLLDPEELLDCEIGLFLGGLLLINPWASWSPCKNILNFINIQGAANPSFLPSLINNNSYDIVNLWTPMHFNVPILFEHYIYTYHYF